MTEVARVLTANGGHKNVLSVFPMDWLFERVRGELKTYLLLDGAAAGNILQTVYELESNPIYVPLFAGTRYHKLLGSGPLLVSVTPQSPVFSWFTNESFTFSGFLIGTTVEQSALVAHLQEHLTISLSSKEEGLFRFYDPVVFFDWVSASEHQYAKSLTQAFDLFAVNTFSSDNINCWYLGTAREPSAVDRFPKGQAISPDVLEFFENLCERRLINAHITALKIARGLEPSINNKGIEDLADLCFNLKSVRAKQSYIISGGEYAEAYSRLERYEERYGVPVFEDLLKLDHLMSLNNASARQHMDGILNNRALPFSRRLEICTEYLRGEHVSA
jgi:hypothetical protein